MPARQSTHRVWTALLVILLALASLVACERAPGSVSRAGDSAGADGSDEPPAAQVGGRAGGNGTGGRAGDSGTGGLGGDPAAGGLGGDLATGGRAGDSGMGGHAANPDGPEIGATSFESANPNPWGAGVGGCGHAGTGGATGGTGGVGGNTAIGGAGSVDDDSAGAERAIEEADIIQVQDDRLYAMSPTGGLSVIDVAMRDRLALLGNLQMDAQPFEMYVRDDVVFGLFTGWGRYDHDADTDSDVWVNTSQVVALDVADPGNIEVIGAFEVLGDISDSRIAGNILYVVAYENGLCWNCGITPETEIVSLDVSSPEQIEEVDRLSFADAGQGSPYGRRSVTVTTERLYVSGPRYDSAEDSQSTIQVVDISDPTGELVAGASFDVDGWITSRWQMDEYEGVLRVISQPPSWSPEHPPTIQTFEVVSSQQVEPLGRREMVLPGPEMLRTVRFDGPRAYAITFEVTDPLFTIDLSNPEDPVQAGALETPGWVYHLEPRGDRIFALGFDGSADTEALNVSLFDVSDFANPTMLDRVGFGGDWGSFAEDQDRIHKAFHILDELGLILVPFAGRDVDSSACHTGYVSGVQLIDFTDASLTLRGVAPQHGQARRALIRDERMLTVSDERVQSFDIGDRDAPIETAALPIAMHVKRTVLAGDYLLRFRTDWWTGEVHLDVTSAEAPDDAAPLGSIDLMQELLDRGVVASRCDVSWRLYDAPVFVNGSVAYLLLASYGYYWLDEPSVVLAIDFSDTSHPVLTDAEALGFDLDASGYCYHGSRESRRQGYLLDSGEAMAQVGGTVVVRRLAPAADDSDEVTAHWELIDFGDLTDIQWSSGLVGATGLGHTGLLRVGSAVYSSHWEAVDGDPSRVRFYVDGLDLSNPQDPVRLAPVNVPGSLVSLDAETGLAITMDYTGHEEALPEPGACSEAHPGTGSYDYGDGQCSWLDLDFRLVRLDGTQARLLDTLPLDDSSDVVGLHLGEDRVFSTAFSYDPLTSHATVVSIGGETLREGSASYEFGSGYHFSPSSATAASGARAVVTLELWRLGVVDATDPTAPTLEPLRTFPENQYPYEFDILGDRVLCSRDDYGLEVIDLP